MRVKHHTHSIASYVLGFVGAAVSYALPIPWAGETWFTIASSIVSVLPIIIVGLVRMSWNDAAEVEDDGDDGTRQDHIRLTPTKLQPGDDGWEPFPTDPALLGDPGDGVWSEYGHL